MDVLVEDEPEPVPMTPPPRARVLPLAKTGPRGPARAVEPVPLVGPQAEADLPLRCSTAWLGAGQLRGQPLCLERARLLVVSLKSPENLARDWGEVFGIIARTLWHGDCVVVHCMAGRHRAALLVCVTLALLGGTLLAATETWMLTRRQIELNEVWSRDPQLCDWANRAVRGTRMPLQYPVLIGFTATESSHLHLQLPDGTTLCRHAQGQARASNRLRNAYSTSDRREAVAWQRPICDECFRRASASFWPVV